MNEINTFDPIWEQIYCEGRQLNRYPFDLVVSFIYNNYPRHKPRHETRILEVGCGSANNLWFAAREGFRVAGIDGSPSSIDYAQKRFNEEGLTGDLRVGDFTQLPFEDNSFDLVIDRCLLTCCGQASAQRAVAEIGRVLLAGGKFLFNPYSDRHSSYTSGRPGPDGLTLDIAAGTLVGVGQICFYSRREVDAIFAAGWKMLSVQHLEIAEEVQAQRLVHAEWRIVAEKVKG